MKKILFSVMTVACLLWAGYAFAIPTLQLDISDSFYDSASETVVSSSDSFSLYALLNANYTNREFYLSAAISPAASGGSDLGTFSFDGAIYNVTDDMLFGTPALGDDSLPGHGIFDTYYIQFAFSFAPNLKAVKYNVQDNPGGFAEGDAFYYRDFDVDVSGLAAGSAIHFDLYGFGDNGKFIKAPFSHDAQSGERTPVPEPSTLLLLGAGLVGFGIYSRKRGKL